MLTKNPISFTVSFFVIFLYMTQGETAAQEVSPVFDPTAPAAPDAVPATPAVPSKPTATAPSSTPPPRPVEPVQPTQRPAAPHYSPPVLAYLQKWHGFSTKMGINSRAPYHLLVTSCGGCVPYIINCKFPISNLTPLRGIRVRSSQATSPWLKSIGAIPVLMPGANIPAALQKGEVDCVVAGGMML